MNNHIIYKLTFPNGKVYIGQTVQIFERRLGRHKLNAHSNSVKNKSYNTYLSNAIRKYGWNNVVKEVLFTVPENFVDELETEMISKYDSANRMFGYNILSVGGSAKGYVHSNIAKFKMMGRTPWNKEKTYSDEQKQNMRKPKQNTENMKNPKSTEHIKKLSESKLGIKRPDLVGENNGMFGRKESEEHKNIRIQKLKKPIIALTVDGSFVNIFESLKKASTLLKLSKGHISSVLCGRLSHTKGYTFKFLIGNSNANNT